MTRPTRAIVTALITQDARLLLVQLAKGRLADFWLLPSATVESESLEDTLGTMVLERTGYPVLEQRLVSVIEESRVDSLSLRFVFHTHVGSRDSAIGDSEIAQARWFTKDAVLELLAEREVVPTLGVMALLRSWAEGVSLHPLESLVDDALCPCGSGYSFKGCCGWDAK